MIPLQDDNPVSRPPLVTYSLIGINVVVFLWTLTLPPVELQQLQYRRGFVPARIGQLLDARPIEVPIRQQVVLRREAFGFGRHVVQHNLLLAPRTDEILLSLLTCMFLHGGWFHLIGNMWFLWVFGDNVEDWLGPLLYLALYLVGGVLATACHWLYDPGSRIPMVGASGAISTVLGAYAVAWPLARVRTIVILGFLVTTLYVPAVVFLGIWFVGQLLSGAEQLNRGAAGGVAWWAHVGGFVAGAVLMPLLSALFVWPRVVRARTADAQPDEDLDDLW